MTLLTRDDVIAGLRDLIDELHRAEETATIRIVGGSALALRHFSHRMMSRDVDALRLLTGSETAVLEAVARIADRRGWSHDWFNFEVASADAEPTMGSRHIEWETVYDTRGVVVQIADASSMLAMKLRANRPGRDTDDIRQLLAICEITTVEEADDFYSEFYPGDALSDRAWEMVSRILAGGPLPSPRTPPPLDLGD